MGFRETLSLVASESLHRGSPTGRCLAGLLSKPAGEVILVVDPYCRGDLADREGSATKQLHRLVESAPTDRLSH